MTGNRKTVLVTGVNGFLGSFVARNLSKDHQIIGLKRTSSNIFRITDILPDIICYDVDKLDPESIFKKHPIDVIIHTATNYGTNCELSEVLKANLHFPLEIISAGLKNNVKAFINTDTFYDPSYSQLKDYTFSKAKFLEEVKKLDKGIKVVNLKIGVIFGPTDNRNKFTPVMINRLLNNEPEIDLTPGIQKRNFLYVEEAAQVYRIVIEKLNSIPTHFTEYNLGTGEATSIRDYINCIHQIAGSRSKLNFGALELRAKEIMDPDEDISGINSLGWRPALTLEQALSETVHYERSLR